MSGKDDLKADQNEKDPTEDLGLPRKAAAEVPADVDAEHANGEGDGGNDHRL